MWRIHTSHKHHHNIWKWPNPDPTHHRPNIPLKQLALVVSWEVNQSDPRWYPDPNSMLWVCRNTVDMRYFLSVFGQGCPVFNQHIMPPRPRGYLVSSTHVMAFRDIICQRLSSKQFFLNPFFSMKWPNDWKFYNNIVVARGDKRRPNTEILRKAPRGKTGTRGTRSDFSHFSAPRVLRSK